MVRTQYPTGHREESGYEGNQRPLDCKKYGQYCNENGKPKSSNELAEMRNRNESNKDVSQSIARTLSTSAAVLDLVSLGISISGSFIELSHGAVGAAGGGGPSGFAAGFVEGVIEYNINPLLNPAENVLGWTSFGMVFTSDWFAGNSKIHTNQDGSLELVIGQDTLVSFTAAFTGSASPLGEGLSDTGINMAIFGYDILRLTNKIPTSLELRVNADGVFLSSP